MFMIPPPIRTEADQGPTRDIEAVDLCIGHDAQFDGLRYAVVGVRYDPDKRIVTATVQRGESTAITKHYGADALVTVYIKQEAA